ncbi:MAG: DUF493 domain-containing protein [Campylobacterales bacterium]|nr:DUF493 domain-containing protein [Campylobacterales bacterium]
MINLEDHKLELDYPCKWEYKLVMRQEIDIKIVLQETIGQREHKVTISKKSSKGKFISHKVQMLVHNEDDRKELHHIFHAHKNIDMIV